jgi:hypothetical protein
VSLLRLIALIEQASDSTPPATPGHPRCEGRATPPAGMHRWPNAAGLPPRAVKPEISQGQLSRFLVRASNACVGPGSDQPVCSVRLQPLPRSRTHPRQQLRFYSKYTANTLCAAPLRGMRNASGWGCNHEVSRSARVGIWRLIVWSPLASAPSATGGCRSDRTYRAFVTKRPTLGRRRSESNRTQRTPWLRINEPGATEGNREQGWARRARQGHRPRVDS